LNFPLLKCIGVYRNSLKPSTVYVRVLITTLNVLDFSLQMCNSEIYVVDFLMHDIFEEIIDPKTLIESDVMRPPTVKIHVHNDQGLDEKSVLSPYL
jgi:hypothetical protein